MDRELAELSGAEPLATLSGYALRRLLGAGGMGTVWLADRADRPGRVALKILTGYAARHPAFLTAFRAEVRAYAGLAHPNIVGIVDRGIVTEDEAAGSTPDLAAGSPFVVMEYLSGGSLKPFCGQLPWREVRAILLSLLDGLAHAHARGLVHCDLKPENVLLDHTRTTVKLTDFGLVHAVDRATPGERDKGVAGTPHYMAPEQTDGRWRDYGPWTDMYGLGGLAWALLSGRPPFSGLRTPFAILRAHREVAPPPFVSAVAVPPGVDRWLERLLGKRPSERFQRASEAAAALLALGSVVDARTRDDDGASDEQPTDPGFSPQLTVLVSTTHSTLAGALTAVGAGAPIAPEVGARAQPVPLDWRGDGASSASTAPAPGLGLFWLRTLPVVGREAERDRLWALVREAAERREPRFVAIRGASGSGASRLGRWLGERAHEIAGADVLYADFAGEPSGWSALRAMVSRRFTLGGLEAVEARRRLRATLDGLGFPDDEGRVGLLELAAPSQRGGLEDSQIGAPPGLLDAALDGLAGLIGLLARSRPVVLVLDEGASAPRARGLVDRLARDRGGPVVVAATGHDDRPIEVPFESVPLAPMASSERALLVRQILRLEPSLAVDVEERCGGNPLFALQLVGGWIDRDLLAPSPDGFRLVHAGAGRLPDDLHEVWAGRVQDFLAGRSVHDGPALELLAVFGAELDEDLFWALCERAGLTPSLSLLEGLLDEGLARGAPGGPQEGFWLGHAMLRDSLRRRASEGGRSAEHHRACARTLGTLGGPAASERIARHLLAAGRPAEALGPLLAGVSALVQQGETRRAWSLLAEHEAALRALRVPERDVAWGRGLLLEVRLAARDGDEARFERTADRAEELGERHQWGPIPVYVAFERAVRSRRRGRFDEAQSGLELVRAWAAEHEDRSLLVHAQTQLAGLHRARGDLGPATELLEASAAACLAMGERSLAAHALLGLAEIAARQRDAGRKERRLAEAAALWDEVAGRLGLAATERVQGVAACVDGDLVVGAALLRSSARRFRASLPAAATEVEIELGHRLALAGQRDEARTLLAAALLRAESAGDGGQAAAARAGLLACGARAGDEQSLVEHAAALELLLADGVGLTADALECLREARRHPERAALLLRCEA